MKKAKSTTKKSKVIEFDLEKIKRFTEQELSRLSQQNTDLPFCYQIGSDVLVGECRVKKQSDSEWTVYHRNYEEFTFFTRKDAIFYCIAIFKNQIDLANTIKTQDQLLSRLEFDAIIYRKRYKTATDKGDEFKAELYSTRYLDTMDRISGVKKELQNCVNLAKYIKVKI